MSFLKRFYSEVGNALSDAYGHVLLGDDAGSSENFVFIARGRTVKVGNLAYRKFDLGMTFICVDGRACVKTVHPTTEAALAGIQPRDILQLALVLLPDQLELLEDDEEEIAAHALDCEKSGMRTYFDDFRDMFETCSVAKGKNSGTIFDLSNKSELYTKKGKKFSLRSTTQMMVGRCAGNDSSFVHSDTSPASPSGDVIHPVALVFRRTKNREIGDTSHIGIPSFRLDDECERAASLLTHLAPPSQIAQEKNRSNSLLKRDNGFGLDAVCSPAKGFPGNVDDVETATLRDLIKNSLGLAFVRSSKVVLGLSLHFGSGLVISRLGDGSWSAPSAIGVYGAGLGIQFGLEVAEYIFLIQTNEALEHFKRGEHFTIGGNMGAAFAGHGREAYGAASVGASGDESKGPSKNNVASVVAYAKSQGLYFGVSLEGSKIFTRDEINNRTYKFIAGNEVSTHDILIGKVPIPREATNLYSTLHRLENGPQDEELRDNDKVRGEEISISPVSDFSTPDFEADSWPRRKSIDADDAPVTQQAHDFSPVKNETSALHLDNRKGVNSSEHMNSTNEMTSSHHDQIETSSIPPSSKSPQHREGPKYIYGQAVKEELLWDLMLPLPLPLCRALFLDSTSPIMNKWEAERGDMNYTKSKWSFHPSTKREIDDFFLEHQLIANGPMIGGYRTTSFDQIRKGHTVSSAETLLVDADDSRKLEFTISERMPRRGFSVKVQFIVVAVSKESCRVSVDAVLRPMGKKMSNQDAVHKAFVYVNEKLIERYGVESGGMLTGFLNPGAILASRCSFDEKENEDVNHNCRNSSETSSKAKKATQKKTYDKEFFDSNFETKNSMQGEDFLSGSTDKTIMTKENRKGAGGRKQIKKSPVADLYQKTPHLRKQNPDRAATPSVYSKNNNMNHEQEIYADFEEWEPFEDNENRPAMTIDVKPLTKLRLDLMPAPKEEDEYF